MRIAVRAVQGTRAVVAGAVARAVAAASPPRASQAAPRGETTPLSPPNPPRPPAERARPSPNLKRAQLRQTLTLVSAFVRLLHRAPVEVVSRGGRSSLWGFAVASLVVRCRSFVHCCRLHLHNLFGVVGWCVRSESSGRLFEGRFVSSFTLRNRKFVIVSLVRVCTVVEINVRGRLTFTIRYSFLFFSFFQD